MKNFTEKLFNLFSPSMILKIIIIFTLFLSINCSDNMIILFDEPVRKIAPSYLIILENTTEFHEVALFAVTDSMGRLILCGYVQIPGEDSDAAMWRYFLDGTLDTSFGINGRITWDSPMGYDDKLYTIKINPDGSIMTGGYANNSANSSSPSPSVLMGKFDSNGQPDTSFSPDGFKLTPSVWSRATWNSTFDSSGNLLTSGFINDGTTFDFSVVRTTNSLDIDTTFSNNGYFIFDSSQAPLNEAGNKEYASNVLVDSGNIYISGPRDWTWDSAILKLQESDGAIIDVISGIPFKTKARQTFIRDDYIYLSGYNSDSNLGWAKINKNDLTFDAGYGTGGYQIEESPGLRPMSVYVNPIGEAYIGVYQSNATADAFILKATSTGEVDTGWANNGELLYPDLGFPGSHDYIFYILENNSEMVVIGLTEVMINSTPYRRIFLHVGHENYMD